MTILDACFARISGWLPGLLGFAMPDLGGGADAAGPRPSRVG
jgi:hypothetical protein